MSAEEGLTIVVATLRRMVNSHSPIAHRLPPEILGAVASNFKEDHRSLNTATHLCQYWRSTLLSFPRLWTHIGFGDEKRALAFVERSKSLPASISFGRYPPTVTRELSTTFTNRLVSLQGTADNSMGRFLVQPLPLLQGLVVVEPGGPSHRMYSEQMPELPSVRSLTITDVSCLLFCVPNLTYFCFRLVFNPFTTPPMFVDGLLALFLGCPLLETVFLVYGDPSIREFPTYGPSTHPISLPCLRSFARVSPRPLIANTLVDELSLPPTCEGLLRLEGECRVGMSVGVVLQFGWLSLCCCFFYSCCRTPT